MEENIMTKQDSELNFRLLYPHTSMEIVKITPKKALLKVKKENTTPKEMFNITSLVQITLGDIVHRIDFEVDEDGNKRLVTFSWGPGTPEADQHITEASKYARTRVMTMRTLYNAGVYPNGDFNKPFKEITVKQVGNPAYDVIVKYDNDEVVRTPIHFDDKEDADFYKDLLEANFCAQLMSPVDPDDKNYHEPNKRPVAKKRSKVTKNADDSAKKKPVRVKRAKTAAKSGSDTKSTKATSAAKKPIATKVSTAGGTKATAAKVSKTTTAKGSKTTAKHVQAKSTQVAESARKSAPATKNEAKTATPAKKVAPASRENRERADRERQEALTWYDNWLKSLKNLK